MNKNIFKNNKTKGFTLLETMVAIMLFVLALSALLALVKDSVTSAIYNKNEVIATYLAQEGIDYIRNVRDEMVFVSPTMSPWADFTDEIMSSSKSGCDGGLPTDPGCELDTLVWSNYDLKQCLVTCPTMNVSGKLFRRRITATNPSPDSLLIKVEVTWYNGTTQRSRILTTSLYNWAL